MKSFSEVKKCNPGEIDPQLVLKKITASGHADSGRIYQIPVGDIFPNPNQPRKSSDEASLLRLADSIRKCGIIHPITVRLLSDGNDNRTYEIVIGERRYRAACLLKFETVPCLIISSDTKKSAEFAIIENIQRENLHYIDQANAINSLISVYRMSIDEIASRLSVTKKLISYKLSFLNFSEFERSKLIEYRFSECMSSLLLKIDDPELRTFAIQHIYDNALDYSSAVDFIDTLTSGKNYDNKLVLKDIGIFYNTIDKAVSIIRNAGIDVLYKKREDCDSSVLTIKISNNSNVSRET